MLEQGGCCCFGWTGNQIFTSRVPGSGECLSGRNQASPLFRWWCRCQTSFVGRDLLLVPRYCRSLATMAAPLGLSFSESLSGGGGGRWCSLIVRFDSDKLFTCAALDPSGRGGISSTWLPRPLIASVASLALLRLQESPKSARGRRLIVNWPRICKLALN